MMNRATVASVSTTIQTLACAFRKALSKDLPKQVPQDNVAVFLIKIIAKYLARLLGVSSQLFHITKGLDSFLGILTSSSPFNQINNIDMCPSYRL
jgi:hypothetical protein